jgi:hypothetical protein
MTIFTQPWGWSKLDVFRTCKKKFEFQFIEKIPEPGNDAMKRGGDIHETLEAYLQGWISDLPVGLVDWKDRLDELKRSNFTAEQAIGLDKDWKVLQDWFQKTVWLRAKMDAKVLRPDDTLSVIDFKTGRYRIPHEDQVELYAVVGHALHPHIKSATAEYWFIDANDSWSKTYTAEELLALRKKYEAEAQKIYDTQVWSESPSRDCKWCTYSKSKGGKCRY